MDLTATDAPSNASGVRWSLVVKSECLHTNGVVLHSPDIDARARRTLGTRWRREGAS